MTQQPFKPVLLDLLRDAQIDQNAFFQQLPESTLNATGTLDFWSAKDHVAHMTFWRQQLALKVQAIIREEPQPDVQDFEQQNPLIFEEQRYRPWSAILSESDQAYADLILLSAQLSEEDLTAWGRFDWMNDGMPLYTSYMGYCYEHTQNHQTQYFLDRHESARALENYEKWTSRVIEAGVPEQLKGYMFYKLACFYATHSHLEQAWPVLQRALNLYPGLKEFALIDPDLFALRVNFSQ